MAGRFFLIYVVKYYPVTRLPDREISLPDCYPVIYYPARVLQSLARNAHGSAALVLSEWFWLRDGFGTGMYAGSPRFKRERI